jgi:flavin reductase (DIM6/NTAB) family NADH-FMN oxidoreductase RutF
MSKLQIPPNEALYPVPVVLVSCLDKANKRANVITIAWCGIVASQPPQISVSIRPSRHSHALITAERSFVINIPTRRIMEKADLCGILSGSKTDKFKACSFTAVPASKISAPMIQECPVNIECTLKDVLTLGSHDVFIGEVVAVHADTSVVDDKGRIDYGKTEPFVFNQGEYWDLGKKIGFYGCSSK